MFAPIAALVLVFLQPLVALAHPLGNFTVNRYSRLEISTAGVQVRYVLDMAEIPTFQAITRPPDGSPALDANGDGKVSDAEQRAFAQQLIGQIAGNLQLSIGGKSVALRPESSELALLPGQAGLQTLRLTAWLSTEKSASLVQAAGGVVPIDYHDGNDPERLGWREIVVRASDGIAVGGTASSQDVSDELRTYPQDMLASPLDVRQVSFDVTPGGLAAGSDAPAAAASPRPANSAGASLSRASDGFAELWERMQHTPITPPVLAIAFATAVVLGGMHALSPGHGKTIVGAYLVGSRGTPKHAVFLGLTVTAVHTAGVFTLCLITIAASQRFHAEQIYPWLSLASGVLVLGMGVALVRARWRPARAAWIGAATDSAHGHNHDHLGHDDVGPEHYRDGRVELTHSHGLGSHTHVLPGAGGEPVTWRSLLALGVSGGLLPCPSALLVLLSAVYAHLFVLGFALLVAFSLGLAGTLMAVGLLMVYSGRTAGRLRLLDRMGAARSAAVQKAARTLPLASAGVVSLAGLLLTWQAVQTAPIVGLGERLASLQSLAVLSPLALGVGMGALAAVLALRSTPRAAHVQALDGEHAAWHDHGHSHAGDGHAHTHALAQEPNAVIEREHVVAAPSAN